MILTQPLGELRRLSYRQDYRWKALGGADTFVASRHFRVCLTMTDEGRNILAKA